MEADSLRYQIYSSFPYKDTKVCSVKTAACNLRNGKFYSKKLQ